MYWVVNALYPLWLRIPATLTFPVKDAPAKGANAVNSASTSCASPWSSRRDYVPQVKEVNVLMKASGSGCMAWLPPSSIWLITFKKASLLWVEIVHMFQEFLLTVHTQSFWLSCCFIYHILQFLSLSFFQCLLLTILYTLIPAFMLSNIVLALIVAVKILKIFLYFIKKIVFHFSCCFSFCNLWSTSFPFLVQGWNFFFFIYPESESVVE